MKNLFFQLWMSGQNYHFTSLIEPKSFERKTRFYENSKALQEMSWHNSPSSETMWNSTHYWRLDIFGNSVFYNFEQKEWIEGVQIPLDKKDYLTTSCYDGNYQLGCFVSFENTLGFFDAYDTFSYPKFFGSSFVLAKKVKWFHHNDGPILLVYLFQKGGLLFSKHFYHRELSSIKMLENAVLPIEYETIVDYFVLSYKHLVVIDENNVCTLYNIANVAIKKITEWQIDPIFTKIHHQEKKWFGFHKILKKWIPIQLHF